MGIRQNIVLDRQYGAFQQFLPDSIRRERDIDISLGICIIQDDHKLLQAAIIDLDVAMVDDDVNIGKDVITGLINATIRKKIG